jgi:4-hydroxybenzoate polyprenyltransferase
VISPSTDSKSAILPLIRVLRIHQWSKNLLLFLPILAAHHAGNRAGPLQVGLGFLSFSCRRTVRVLRGAAPGANVIRLGT